LKRLLDTNAYTALKRGDERVAALVRESSELLFSIVVVGELLFGFRNGTRYDRSVKELDELLLEPRVSVLTMTRSTADRFGRIASKLRKAGTPIPTNDIWIAAHVFESGGELVSFDEHFKAVDGLVWMKPG